MYSLYTSPYFSRHQRSSGAIKISYKTIHVIVNNRKTQEAQAMPMPTLDRKPDKQIGFLEIR
jgi:hypothetical protein